MFDFQDKSLMKKFLRFKTYFVVGNVDLNIAFGNFIDFLVVRNLQTIRKSILFTYLFWGKMLTCDFFLFFLCDLTFFLGEKATSAAFSASAFGLGLENMPWLPFPPEKKSNHTCKTKKSHFHIFSQNK